ncbi:hypothetical protein AM609_13240 [Actinomyces sp. oral taxon 414]|uniref:AAA family ATPase n=1 Tax=Actinomyces sp. oral taxon 414 TaxID=712122 RepID=UPI0006AFD5F9|nr:ATP-binding protein [Actinomyces sp. oral taxon 414]ALD00158.1 hypothetical protein AM609_13240 [Actinomyces sp. oral taxon 414]
MLRFLRLQNWKSYYEPVEFTMVATRERRHGDRLARVGRSRILPVTAIYGANAAGKSALVDGLEALREIVLESRRAGAMLPLAPHLPEGKDEPTAFAVEIVVSAVGTDDVADRVFYYELAADRRRIHRELLAQVKSRTKELLFERENDVTLYGELDDDARARAHAMVVAPNETLLGALGAERDGTVGVVWDWFAHRLNIIHPESMYMHLLARINADAVFSRAMSSGLTRADTGISEVRLEEMKMEALPVGADQLTGLLEGLRERGGTFVIAVGGADHAILSLTDEGEPTARRLVTVHEREDGPAPEQRSSFTLPLREESDGTQRFMNLLPILFQLRDKNSRSVFVVDELENSMHPKLTEDCISSFLEGLGADDRCQLIFTTHEIQLMRSDLLRRDEIWLADKVDGQSRLTRVSDFAGIGVRKDADLLSFYMSGRLGGVPRI